MMSRFDADTLALGSMATDTDGLSLLITAAMATDQSYAKKTVATKATGS